MRALFHNCLHNPIPAHRIILSQFKFRVGCFRFQFKHDSIPKIFSLSLKNHYLSAPASPAKAASLTLSEMTSSSLPSPYSSQLLISNFNKERDESRTRIYEFLRNVGIVPNELNGLELPLKVEIMKERIDFLHSLGLTIDDINNYPLVLGCSVKKNMIPVLDYLGMLGLRKSTFTDFLRRYPQVLHSSVVIDLMPVVKYLQGLDIKLADIPRVLERYPELLGFKLEGTMSTSVAYLVGIGVARREIGGVLTRYPEIMGMRVGRFIKPIVEYLESLGLPKISVARIVEKRPHVLGYSLEEQVKPNVAALIEFGIRKDLLSPVIAWYPDLLGMELKEKLVSQQNLFESNMLANHDEFVRIIEMMPQVIVLSSKAVLSHVDFLRCLGLSLKQMSRMVIGCPHILALDINVMRTSFEYFKMEMGRNVEELVEFPAYFTYCLESTIKPRQMMIAKNGLKCSLAWMLDCCDSKFEKRMSYDAIGIEEMEVEPREEEEDELEEDFDSVYDGEYDNEVKFL